ncbi:SRPBCC family protein [Microlunatus soli]|uniref:Polyketide cyclase / dehydrase and lipid transport n=1 Tax=Microlunatus soli TaxID=630515 RepID=A0A1H1NDQ5_9ACTN|nr:SRPBCC family protein [Microlunatus soli]SDR96549.1 Polyketide cyclase / dehydrase and lipid transport [Microlunatus soli]
MAASATDSGGLKGALQDALNALGDRAMQKIQDQVSGLTDRLTDIADGGGAAKKAAAKGAEEAAQGGSPVKGALKGGVSAVADKAKEALPGSGGSGGGKNQVPAATKAMNFVESIDVGVPVRVAYNQWTQYEDWPGFMKKLEHAEQEKDQPKVTMKGQVFWSHRTWDSTIIDQIPDERIIWRSTGQKGHVDGCVTFHEIGPRLTRILITLEYYPQGLFERTGNLWRAQGRRARLEIKHFRRHVMMNTILNPDEVEGWRGEIENEEVIRTHEEGLEDDRRADAEQEDDQDAGSDDGVQDEDDGQQDEDEEQQDEDEEQQDEDEEQQDEDEEQQDEDEDGEQDEEEDATESGRR